MFQLKINEAFDVQLSPQHLAQKDILALPDAAYNIIEGDRSYVAQVTAADLEAKRITVTIDGQDYQVQISDPLDQLIQEMGLTVAAGTGEKEIKAPMPGLVLQLMVEEGQTIQKGDSLLILEAMKMENVLKATTDGTVQSIKVTQGAPVDKNQILIELA